MLRSEEPLKFGCPHARSMVMRIVDGEGTGSVVETHATHVGVSNEVGR
jgi:hypothetical protein